MPDQACHLCVIEAADTELAATDDTHTAVLTGGDRI